MATNWGIKQKMSLPSYTLQLERNRSYIWRIGESNGNCLHDHIPFNWRGIGVIFGELGNQTEIVFTIIFPSVGEESNWEIKRKLSLRSYSLQLERNRSYICPSAAQMVTLNGWLGIGHTAAGPYHYPGSVCTTNTLNPFLCRAHTIARLHCSK